MSEDDVLFGYRMQLVDLAGRVGVSAARRTFGVHRRLDFDDPRWKVFHSPTFVFHTEANPERGAVCGRLLFVRPSHASSALCLGLDRAARRRRRWCWRPTLSAGVSRPCI